jgi:hypothetical protein
LLLLLNSFTKLLTLSKMQLKLFSVLLKKLLPPYSLQLKMLLQTLETVVVLLILLTQPLLTSLVLYKT